MSDKLETDALWHEMNTGNYQPSWWFVAEKMRNHAKQMERERDEGYQKITDLESELRGVGLLRDEAIRQLENIKASSIHTCHDQCQRPMCVLRRERDEAREISKAASKGINKTVRLNQFLLSELIAVRKERDELKEIASEFAMTASHCLGWHENKNPNQITSALSRWFKISTNELDA